MRNIVIIADGNELNREMLSEVLGEKFTIVETETGSETVKAIQENAANLAAMIMDANLSEVSGLSILEKISKYPWFEVLPVIVTSDDGSLKSERAAYKAGATEFVRKPFDPGFVASKINKLYDLYSVKEQLIETQEKLKVAENSAKSGTTASTATVQQGGENVAGYSVKVTDDFKELQRIHDNMIELIGQMVEYKNPESHSHVRRIKGLTKIMAEEMNILYPDYNLDEETIGMLVSACALHDIGKIAIPDTIMLKPGRLTDEEYEYMKSHTLRGVDIINTVQNVWNSKYDRIVHEVVRSHHEKFDGGGYPDGLKGDSIPITAQIVSLADTYDALVNDRIYKKAFPKDVAFNMINVGDCGVFPPRILECFKQCRAKLEAWEEGNLDLGKI